MGRTAAAEECLQMPFNPSIYLPKIGPLTAGLAGALLVAAATGDALALTWKGHTWNVTSGGMAGTCKGSPNNVSVDANGYLHLKITNSGGTWTAAELFTAEKLGFGTYQWQIDGPIDRLDKNVVVGLFPYGPAAGIGGDGTNEIDIEYAFWGHADGPNGDFTNYPASGSTIGELSFKFSLNGGTLSTSRFIWNETSIQDFSMSGLEPIGDTTNLIKSFSYAPSNPTMNIPQQALPLGMNLWCFQAPPSDGQNVEIIIRDFQFVPEGTVVTGTGGAGGMTGSAGASGSGGATTGSGGTTSNGGATTGSGGTTSNGGTTTGSGGATSNGGTTTGSGGAATSSGGATSNGGAATGSGGTSTMPGGASEFAGKSAVAGGMNQATGEDSSASGCTCNLALEGVPMNRGLLLLLPTFLAIGRRLRRVRKINP
jgi:hypothetical protein